MTKYILLAQFNDGKPLLVCKGLEINEWFKEPKPREVLTDKTELMFFDSPMEAFDFGCNMLAPDYQFIVLEYGLLICPYSSKGYSQPKA